MPTTKTITLYQYDELPTERAKQTAREWMSQSIGKDFSIDDCDEPIHTAAKLLGIMFDTETHKSRDGKRTWEEAKIFWSGFWSQGDGASYDARYRQDASTLVYLTRLYREFPTDAKLHKIAQGLSEVQGRYNGKLTVRVKHDSSSRYCHKNTMLIDNIELSPDDDVAILDADEEALLKLLRDFADWIYMYLEKEYEYQTGDESVIETIQANEYTFNEDGERED